MGQAIETIALEDDRNRDFRHKHSRENHALRAQRRMLRANRRRRSFANES
jgi:hypothetical protein